MLSTYNPALTRHILPFLEESSLSSIPNDLDFGGIWGIYLHNFHPIFNILDYTGVKGEDGLSLISRSTPYGRILVQGMCLAATLHPDAKRCCRLNGGALLSPRIFADEVALSMRTTLDLGLITHKPTLLKALFLLSFYTQYIQGDLPSQWSSRLVHLAHTMGIHLASNEEGNWVFLDIWALDRLNAAFHGRPVLLHERDSDLNIQVMINDIGPAWPARRLFLQVVMLLDGVIGLYRPATAQNYPKIAFEFPSFEELVLNTGGTRGDNYMLGKNSGKLNRGAIQLLPNFP